MHYLWERINKICEELKGAVYIGKRPVEGIVWKRGRYGSPKEADAAAKDWGRWTPGELWGGRDQHAWFRFTVAAGEETAASPLAVVVSTGEEGWDAINPQGLAFVNGEVHQGLDVNHREILLTEKAEPGSRYQIDVQAYGGMLGPRTSFYAHTAVIDREVEALYYDLVVPLQAVSRLDDDSSVRIDVLEQLNAVVNVLDLRDHASEAFRASVKEAGAILEEDLYGGSWEPSSAIATSVGHTHIDVAWLWTLAQTREKTARSFSTVLRLMEQYPEYIFMSSQAQLYAYLRQDHPELYQQVKDRAAEGRWEVEGGMWVESDCNVTSGESLVRQLLLGKRFFRDEFGVESRVLWLPDVFGYSAAMPQILKKSGVDYFMTTKIGWNQFNKIPYDTFSWRGIDGSEVLTHFVTTRDYEKDPSGHYTTYNGRLTPVQVMGAWQRYQQKELNKDVLIAYGYGDGGGGTTKEMLEEGRRMNRGVPACPQVQYGTVRDYFERLEKTVRNHKRFPKWAGELYLEYHRGTYTSMARNKRDNRRSELLYQDAEFLRSLAMLVGQEYPQEELNGHWKTILTNQFHDILPGTSIEWVYDESARQYKEVLDAGGQMLESGLTALMGQIAVNAPSLVVWNTLSFQRSDYVDIPWPDGYAQPGLRGIDGSLIPAQRINVSGQERMLFWAQCVPAKGYRVYEFVECDQPQSEELTITTHRLENDFFRITLDDSGAFTSIWDKRRQREVVAAGQRSNVLQAFEDKPMKYDNWDIDIYFDEKMWTIDAVDSITVEESGPQRGCLLIKRPFSRSYIEQRIYIYRHLDRIDVETTVDWREDQVLLKAAFPVDVHSDKATFDIQFGNVERPSHRNTSWDWARFEVCAHKWMDISESGYGVSVLNDSKYGCDVRENIMRLTLLKSGMSPYEKADRETHRFTYALYPHCGDWQKGGVVQMGYQLNLPLRARVSQPQEGDWPQEFSFVAPLQENIVIETVKKAEDSDAFIVRLYEAYNRRTEAVLQFGLPVASIAECSLMEDKETAVNLEGNSCRLTVLPYELKTLKVNLAQ